MAEVSAFRGLRYDEEKAGKLADLVTPPYDIISAQEQQAFYQRNPANVIRLEYAMEQEGDHPGENKYTRAKKSLEEFLEKGWLKEEEQPSIYVYEQVFSVPNGETKSFKGIIARVRLEEFEKQVVIPHEETLSKAKTDRLNLMDQTNCNFSQVYCLYQDEKREIYPAIEAQSQGEPSFSFTTEDGILQRVWILQDPQVLAQITASFQEEQLYIADGHHRYETALNFRNKLRDENPNHTGEEGYNHMMMFLVNMDNPGLLVFPTHRLIRDLPEFQEEKLLEKLSLDFSIEKMKGIDAIEPSLDLAGKKVFGLYTGGDFFYRLVLKNQQLMDQLIPEKSAAYKNLDVSILHSGILERFLGIDKENMANQKNLIYTRSLQEAIEGVQSGGFQCAFILNATQIREIKEVTLGKEKMPQKSTYFWPKLVTGIVINQF